MSKIYIQSIFLRGYGGFTYENIKMAVPNGEEGSGLTIFVGSSGSGKTSVLHSLAIIPSSFGNKHLEFSSEYGLDCSLFDLPLIKISFNNKGLVWTNPAREGCGSQRRNIDKNSYPIRFVPANRQEKLRFPRFYSFPLTTEIEKFLETKRGARNIPLGYFYYNTEPKKEDVTNLLRVLLADKDFDFQYELLQTYNYKEDYTLQALKFSHNNYHYKIPVITRAHHFSGMINLFQIAHALANTTYNVVIDEPEHSLPPAIQKRLAKIIKSESKYRQIIIATHSPYFVDLEGVCESTIIHRLYKEGEISKASHLSKTSKNILKKQLQNYQNPHTFGLQAREVFFLQDKVIITEGQEDVALYPKIASALGLSWKGEFFGWGANGANNIKNICYLLKDLGFKKVVGILDNNNLEELAKLQKEFKGSNYHFESIPADDIIGKNDLKINIKLKDLKNIINNQYPSIQIELKSTLLDQKVSLPRKSGSSLLVKKKKEELRATDKIIYEKNTEYLIIDDKYTKDIKQLIERVNKALYSK